MFESDEYFEADGPIMKVGKVFDEGVPGKLAFYNLVCSFQRFNVITDCSGHH
jgi:hypothetical protein